MPKAPQPPADPPEQEPSVAEHQHDHEHPDKPHKHESDHPTRAELEELKKHKHDPEKPPIDKAPTPALIDKPPPDVKPEKKERVGRGLLW